MYPVSPIQRLSGRILLCSYPSTRFLRDVCTHSHTHTHICFACVNRSHVVDMITTLSLVITRNFCCYGIQSAPRWRTSRIKSLTFFALSLSLFPIWDRDSHTMSDRIIIPAFHIAPSWNCALLFLVDYVRPFFDCATETSRSHWSTIVFALSVTGIQSNRKTFSRHIAAKDKIRQNHNMKSFPFIWRECIVHIRVQMKP